MRGTPPVRSVDGGGVYLACTLPIPSFGGVYPLERSTQTPGKGKPGCLVRGTVITRQHLRPHSIHVAGGVDLVVAITSRHSGFACN
jgi:hypothetical protein